MCWQRSWLIDSLWMPFGPFSSSLGIKSLFVWFWFCVLYWIYCLQGTADEVVDCSHGKQLWELSKEKYEPLWLKGGGHCNLELYPEYIRHLRKFVSSLEKSSLNRNGSRRSTDRTEHSRRSVDRVEQSRKSVDRHEHSRKSADKSEQVRKSTDQK